MMGTKIRSFSPQPREASLEDLVPDDHFYRRLEAQLDLSFVRDLVEPLYANGGRPSVDPVVFFKLQLVMFFEDLRSERQLMRAVADRISVRWYVGYDGGKKVKGRKRHILVDTEGFVLKAKVHSAKVMDFEGIKTLLRRADGQFPRLSHLWVDAGYRGEDKGADWVRKTLGWSVDLVERPKKLAPEEVMTLGGRGNGPKRACRWIGRNCCPPEALWCCRGGG
jgi:transposase